MLTDLFRTALALAVGWDEIVRLIAVVVGEAGAPGEVAEVCAFEEIIDDPKLPRNRENTTNRKNGRKSKIGGLGGAVAMSASKTTTEASPHEFLRAPHEFPRARRDGGKHKRQRSTPA